MLKRLPTILVAGLFAVSVRGETQDPPAPDFLQRFINEAAATGGKRIVIPSGRYPTKPNKRVHLTLLDLADVEIVANGVELICTETTRALDIKKCRNLTLRGLTIDYDPLPFTQGRIVEMSGDKRVHIIELMDGYPAAATAAIDAYEIYNPDTRELCAHTYYGAELEALGPRRIRITKKSPGGLEELGDLAVFDTKHAPRGSIPHAVVLTECENLRLQGITLHASNMFGFLESKCHGSRYLGCRVERRPLAGDLKPREQARLRSLNRDAFHSKHATLGPAYRDCIARYMGDDGIAINGDYHLVTSCKGPRLRVIGKSGGTPDLRPGDPVELVSYTGLRFPDAHVVSITPESEVTEAEKRFIAKQSLNEQLRKRLFESRGATTVVLDRAVEMPLGSLIAPSNRLGNGFEIANCVLGPNRSRGVVIKASGGTITGNRFTGNRLSAILLAPEYYWFEAGSGGDITVADNTITNCREFSVSTVAHSGNRQIAPAGAHRDIRVTGNQIIGSPNPAIVVTSTSGLLLRGNAIREADNDILVPWRVRAFRRLDDPNRKIYLENIENLTSDHQKPIQ